MLIAARYIPHTLSIDSIALLNFMLIQLQQYYIHVYIFTCTYIDPAFVIL